MLRLPGLQQRAPELVAAPRASRRLAQGKRAALIPKSDHDRFGDGFRTPAPDETVVRVAGPAFESLPRRKPRGGWGWLGWTRPMEILGGRAKCWWDFGGWRWG
jgi:hypothetical protein